MFKNLLKRFEEDDDEYVAKETVDPVLEQRRKEKFSAPFYNDEFEPAPEEPEVVVEEPVEEEKPSPFVEEKVFSMPERTSKPEVVKEETKPVVEKPTYQRSRVISPISGVTDKPKPVRATKPSTKPKKPRTNNLVKVISPYYGNFETKEEEAADIVLEPINKNSFNDTQDIPTVEDNLRSISKLVEQEKDELKVIEERTGEFKLDLGETEKEDETLIDAVDDNMSLDELMSLYEKKFKD